MSNPNQNDPNEGRDGYFRCTACEVWVPEEKRAGAREARCRPCANAASAVSMREKDGSPVARSTVTLEKPKIRTQQVREKVEKVVEDLEQRKKVEANAVERELAARELTRRHLLPFVIRNNPSYMPGWVHKDICRRLEKFEKDILEGKSPRLMIQMPPRAGKALVVDTPIPTPRGFTPIGELQPGDEVFDECGAVCRVVAVSEVFYDREIYKVETNDGSFVYADAEHEWVVQLRGHRDARSIRTTRWLAERSQIRRPKVDTQGPLRLPQRPLPIDPYVLGLWLGDGDTKQARICIGEEDIDELRRLLEEAGQTLTDHADPIRFGLPKLHRRLKEMNLLGCKHIPNVYMRASIRQREALLQGLIDSDGHVDHRGHIEFVSMQYPLAASVRELALSLGVKASLREGRAVYNGKDCGARYRVRFYRKNSARLPRKLRYCRNAAEERRGRYLRFEKMESRADTICIQVDSPNRMFLAGDGFIPTHNSELVSVNFPAWFLGRNPTLEIISTSYSADLANDFSRKVRSIVMGELFTATFDGVSIDKDNKGVEGWRLNKSGGYLPAGVGGAITGKGASCASPAVIVPTELGPRPIYSLVNDIVEGLQPPRVLAYSGGNLVWRNIHAASVRVSDHYYNLTVGGRTIQVTGEHPLCVGFEGGVPVYRRVDELREGERVVTLEGEDRGHTVPDEAVRRVPGVWDGVLEEPAQVPRGQEGLRGAAPYLFKRLLAEVKVTYEQCRVKLCRVWDKVSTREGSSPASSGTRATRVLFKSLLRQAPLEDLQRGVAPPVHVGDSYLHAVLEGVRAQEIAGHFRTDDSAVLFSRVLLREPEGEKYRARETGPAVVSTGVQTAAGIDHGRETAVRSMRGAGNVRTPQGRGQGEQRYGQPRAGLPRVPYTSPHEVTYSRIERLQRVEEALSVVDFEVEEAHNFFLDRISASNCLLIDDPIKNATEAESATTKQAIYDWYRSTAYTRLAPGGGVCIVQTRWAFDDLSGTLEELAEKDPKADQWEIVRYPAIALEDEKYRRKGEALHPERYDEEAYERIRNSVGPRYWAALYQQQPTPDEGGYFQRDMVEWYNGPVPEECVYYTTWDFAIGKNERNDYTVGITAALDKEDNLWLVDMRRGRWNSFEIVEQMLRVQRRYNPRTMGIEKGQIQLAIGPYLEKRIQEERLYEMNIKELPPGRRDKESRARAIQGRMAQGKVWFPRDKDWVDALMQELLQFPNGKHDDAVDALAWIGLMLQDMPAPHLPTVHKKRHSWRDKLSRLGTERKRHFLTS